MIHKRARIRSRRFFRKRSEYDKLVDRLLEKNKEELRKINKYPYKRMSGEYHIANTLARMKIRYIPEFIIRGLKDDSCSYRIADFYLPREDIIIEHCGRWDKDKDRYNEKRKVYLKNKRRYIFIYPKQLNNLDWALEKEILWVIEHRRGWDPNKDGNKNK